MTTRCSRDGESEHKSHYEHKDDPEYGEMTDDGRL